MCEGWVSLCVEVKVKVKVQLYSPLSTHAYSADSFPPLARLAQAHIYMLPATIDPTLNLCTRYPLLLGGQRQCGFKACPRLLQMTSDAGIEPRTI